MGVQVPSYRDIVNDAVEQFKENQAEKETQDSNEDEDDELSEELLEEARAPKHSDTLLNVMVSGMDDAFNGESKARVDDLMMDMKTNHLELPVWPGLISSLYNAAYDIAKQNTADEDQLLDKFSKHAKKVSAELMRNLSSLEAKLSKI